MSDVRVIEVKESVFADNDRKADELERGCASGGPSC